MGKRAILTTPLAISIFLVALATGAAAAGRIIYVDDTATGANDGSSWSDGYNYLQDALADANSAEKPVEIRVAQGIYKPDLSGGNTLGEREATFQLINGVTLKGGYAGFGEPDPNTRNVDLYETVLSGDLHGNDRPNFANHWENSYHVVTSSSTNETAVLDGFTITGGCAVDFAVYGRPPSNLSILRGGGMYGILGSPTLTNCTFYANSASLEGGGMYNEHDSNPMLIDCSFHMNSVYWHGGGMYNKDNSNPNLTNCTFNENWADYGGGISNDFSSPTVNNCTFSGNTVDWDGGGMYNSYSSPTLFNCIFIGNSGYNGGGMENFIRSSPALNDCTFSRNLADESGGGMHNEDQANPTLTNCTFSENSADENGGGMYNHENSDPNLTDCIFIGNSCRNGGGGMWNSMSNPTLFNCTFSGNRANFGGGMVNGFESSPILTNCTFSGNSANDGGGMDNSSNSSPVLTNCKFVGNSASWGGGMYNWDSSPTLNNCTFSGNFADEVGGMFASWDRSSILTNCILWGNTFPQIAGVAAVSYTNVQDGWEGQGNIDADPLFAEPGYWRDVNDPNIVVEPNDPNVVWVDGDYHLESEGGRWDPSSQSWVQDDVTSPCIDAGDPATSIGLEPFPDGGIINMGAYGGTAEASKSPAN